MFWVNTDIIQISFEFIDIVIQILFNFFNFGVRHNDRDTWTCLEK